MAAAERRQPLSVQQEYLWLFEQLNPGSTAYTVCRGLILTGPLDVPALGMAVTGVVRRNGALRTAVRSDAGRPYGVLRPPPDVIALPVETVPQGGEIDAARQWASAPFDLATDLLLRALLLVLGGGRRILLLACHHIAVDDLSLQLITRQLAHLYAAERGQVAAPPTDPYDYAEYARWQRQELAAELIRRGEAEFWREQLRDAPSDCGPPADAAPNPAPTGPGRSLECAVPADLDLALRQRAAAEGCTPFIAALTALELVLAHWTGGTDILVGVPFGARTLPGTEAAVGLFVNTLVLRTNLAPAGTIREAFRLVRTTSFEAFDHHLMPYEWLSRLRPGGASLRQRPLVRVGFQMLEPAWPVPPPWPEPLTVEVWDGFADEATRLDLEVHLVPAPGGGTRVVLNYRADLLRAGTVEAFLRAYLRALHAVAHQPDDRWRDCTAAQPRPAVSA